MIVTVVVGSGRRRVRPAGRRVGRGLVRTPAPRPGRRRRASEDDGAPDGDGGAAPDGPARAWPAPRRRSRTPWGTAASAVPGRVVVVEGVRWAEVGSSTYPGRRLGVVLDDVGPPRGPAAMSADGSGPTCSVVPPPQAATRSTSQQSERTTVASLPPLVHQSDHQIAGTYHHVARAAARDRLVPAHEVVDEAGQLHRPVALHAVARTLHPFDPGARLATPELLLVGVVEHGGRGHPRTSMIGTSTRETTSHRSPNRRLRSSGDGGGDDATTTLTTAAARRCRWGGGRDARPSSRHPAGGRCAGSPDAATTPSGSGCGRSCGPGGRRSWRRWAGRSRSR